MKFLPCFRVLSLFTISLLGLVLAGCIITNNSNTKITGHVISDDTFAQIQPGKTKDFVTGLIGQPSLKTTADSGNEVWKWNYSETKIAERSFIVLFESSDATTTKQTTVVEFNKDGVVTKTSRE
jgi:outer membrane protein assembly factor BamE (lipoprotein component of BamABCDE complex)